MQNYPDVEYTWLIQFMKFKETKKLAYVIKNKDGASHLGGNNPHAGSMAVLSVWRCTKFQYVYFLTYKLFIKHSGILELCESGSKELFQL